MADLFKAAAAILGLLLVVLAGAGLVVGKGGLFAISIRQTDSPAAAAPAPAPRLAIPPLDAATSAKVETATLALG